MSTFLTVAAVWLTPTILIGLWILADRWLDGRHKATSSARPQPDAEWLDVLKATDTPMYEALKAERDMGPIFEAGYERQAKRLAAELDDESALARWLRGAS